MRSLGLLRFLNQLLKFAVSGLLGVGISTVLFYGFKGQLPILPWVFWAYHFDAAEMGYYELTSIIGGTVHFVLSKVWVFER